MKDFFRSFQLNIDDFNATAAVILLQHFQEEVIKSINFEHAKTWYEASRSLKM